MKMNRSVCEKVNCPHMDWTYMGSVKWYRSCHLRNEAMKTAKNWYEEGFNDVPEKCPFVLEIVVSESE
jgi:hypothetical protein